MQARRGFMGGATALGMALGLAAATGPRWAYAQAYPSRLIKIVVPNAAGGAADLTARTVGQKMAEAMGQSVVIDNRPSAGGVVAGELVARSPADGYTLLLAAPGPRSARPCSSRCLSTP